MRSNESDDSAKSKERGDRERVRERRHTPKKSVYMAKYSIHSIRIEQTILHWKCSFVVNNFTNSIILWKWWPWKCRWTTKTTPIIRYFGNWNSILYSTHCEYFTKKKTCNIDSSGNEYCMALFHMKSRLKAALWLFSMKNYIDTRNWTLRWTECPKYFKIFSNINVFIAMNNFICYSTCYIFILS